MSLGSTDLKYRLSFARSRFFEPFGFLVPHTCLLCVFQHTSGAAMLPAAHSASASLSFCLYDKEPLQVCRGKRVCLLGKVNIDNTANTAEFLWCLASPFY